MNAPPLTGIRVLDFTRVIAGPYLSLMLGDLGAEVIKIEAPGFGDDARSYRPAGITTGDSPTFVHLNRHKQSVTIDIARPEGRDLCRRLAAEADILLENFRPDVMERQGLDYATLSAINPRLIYASISGYGHTGPYRMVPGYDPIAQAEAGVMFMTGPADLEPQKAGGSVADTFASLHTGMAVMAALHARTATGSGQRIDVALFDSMMAAIGYAHQQVLIQDFDPPRVGNGSLVLVPLGNYDCADGQIALAVGNDVQWRRFCVDVIERPDMATDPRFVTIKERNVNRAAVEAELKAILPTRPRAEWVARTRKAGVPAGEVRTLKQALQSPEVAARAMVQEVEHPTYGRMRTVASPMRLSDTPVRAPSPAPLLGQHTDAVLGRLLGLDAAEIAALREKGAIG